MFHIRETEESLPNSFFEVTINYLDTNTTERLNQEREIQISLMNIDAKILNKILANRIKEHIKKIIHYGEVGFIHEIQGLFKI